MYKYSLCNVVETHVELANQGHLQEHVTTVLSDPGHRFGFQMTLWQVSTLENQEKG